MRAQETAEGKGTTLGDMDLGTERVMRQGRPETGSWLEVGCTVVPITEKGSTGHEQVWA